MCDSNKLPVTHGTLGTLPLYCSLRDEELIGGECNSPQVTIGAKRPKRPKRHRRRNSRPRGMVSDASLLGALQASGYDVVDTHSGRIFRRDDRSEGDGQSTAACDVSTTGGI